MAPIADPIGYRGAKKLRLYNVVQNFDTFITLRVLCASAHILMQRAL